MNCYEQLNPSPAVQAIQFTQTSYYKSEPETFVTGGFLRPDEGFITVQCTGDGLVGANYSIIESDPGPFSVDHETGAISVTADLDYETMNFHQFHVHCLDIDQPSMTATAAVQVEVSSVNEYLPEIDPSSIQFPVFEDLESGTVIVSVLPDEIGRRTYSVSDDDAWPHGVTNARYTILEDSDDIEQYSLDPITGTLTLTGSLDVDIFQDGSHTSRVRINVCDDPAQFEICENLLVALTVISVNDNYPQFSQNHYEITVPVSLPVDSQIDLGISCTDLDQGTGRFEGIELEMPSSLWEVDSRAGLLTLKQSLNTLKSEFMLRCLDTEGIEDTATATVNVNYHPRLNQSVYNFSIERVVPPPEGVAIARVSAIDINGDNITFSLVGNSHFAINAGTGEVRQVDAIDESEGNLFQLTVIASDMTLTDSASVQIRIREKDDGDGTTAHYQSSFLHAITLLLAVLFSCMFV